MLNDLRLNLPPQHSREAILQRLDRVLDPELDQSVLKLGFIESIEAENGHLTVETRLPTHWCAPNFAYMMAEDIRRELLALESVHGVTVHVKDNAVSAAIEAGVNAGKSFAEAFADEGAENLGELRGLFLRKGYLKRQEAVLRRLQEAGLTFAEMAALRLDDVVYEGEACQVRVPSGQVVPIEPLLIMQDYLKRRAEIGLEGDPTAALLVDLRGEPVPAVQLEKYFVYARTVRLAMEANGSLCSALLEARLAEKSKISLI
ncbi:MAG: iron-sulfur cluster assembly protein [Anaerolineae bacterium]